MNKDRMKKTIILLLLLNLLSLISCKEYVSRLSPLDGLYRTVGTRNIVLDDPRNLLLHVWYPAESEGTGELDPIMTQEMADALTKHMGVPKILKEKNMLSRSFKNAPALKTAHFPVIIFEHGYESYARQNLSQMEKLANNGYIVMALSHPGESLATQYPDGKIVLMDKEKYPSLGSLHSKKEKTENAERVRIISSLMTEQDDPYVQERIFYTAFKDSKSVIVVEEPISERITDMAYLLNSLDEINRSGEFANILDLDSIGIYGHSMGGVSAFEAGSRNDLERLPKAVANLDGPMFFYDEHGPIPKVPFLMAYSTETKWGSEKMSLAGINEWIFGQKETDAWEATFYRSTHVNFTDLTYFKGLKRLDVTGKCNGFSAGEAQEQMLIAFFDKYLRGIEPDIESLRDVHDEWELLIR